MKVLTMEKFKVLAASQEWSPDQTRGYIDGEAFRKRGKVLSTYTLVGIDEYCLGFRAGYFDRKQGIYVRPD